MTLDFLKKKSKGKSGQQEKYINMETVKPSVPIYVQTVQNTVPIFAVHENANLIESYENCFSRSYEFKEINFQTSTVEEQELTMTKYRALLNSFGSDMEIAITIFNRNINFNQFSDETLLKETGDKYDHYREQVNKVLIDRVSDGQNALKRISTLLWVFILQALRKHRKCLINDLMTDLMPT